MLSSVWPYQIENLQVMTTSSGRKWHSTTFEKPHWTYRASTKIKLWCWYVGLFSGHSLIFQCNHIFPVNIIMWEKQKLYVFSSQSGVFLASDWSPLCNYCLTVLWNPTVLQHNGWLWNMTVLCYHNWDKWGRTEPMGQVNASALFSND